MMVEVKENAEFRWRVIEDVLHAEASIHPEPMMLQIYLFRTYLRVYEKFQISLFLKMYVFIPQDFWWRFLVIDSKFVTSPISAYISPYFGKNKFFPYFLHFPLFVRSISAFLPH